MYQPNVESATALTLGYRLHLFMLYNRFSSILSLKHLLSFSYNYFSIHFQFNSIHFLHTACQFSYTKYIQASIRDRYPTSMHLSTILFNPVISHMIDSTTVRTWTCPEV